MAKVRFYWARMNRAHVLRHVSLEIAEAVVQSEDLEVSDSGDGLAFTGFATYRGERYFVAFQVTTNRDEIYIITCYPSKGGKI